MKTLTLALVALLVPAPAHAVLVDLTDTQVAEAVAHGTATYARLTAERRPIDDADPEYVVELPGSDGRAILFTEFSTIALETRRWLAIGQQLGPQGIERTLAPLRGRVQVSVFVAGPSRDFLQHWKVRLEQRGRAREPVTSDVYRGTKTANEAGWIAPAQYTFSAKDLDRQAPATLVLTDGDGNELRFDFDLPRLR